MRPRPLSLLYLCAPADEPFADALETHLAPLVSEGLVSVWSPRCVLPGSDRPSEIAGRLRQADLILLLVSADLLALPGIGHITAAVLARQNQATILPVLLRPADWEQAPFAHLLPADLRPVSTWPDEDEAWREVVRGARQAAWALHLGLSVPGVLLLGELGRSTGAVVYRGWHSRLQRHVAVKLLAEQVAAPARERWLEEVRLLSRLDHPNLLRIHDAGHVGGGVYLVSELLDGSLQGNRRFPVERATDLTRQLLLGLQALHGARLLHRAIHPANCLLSDRDGGVRLAEPGTCPSPGCDLETGRYYAPEVAGAPAQIGPAADLYALGMTLQRTLLGGTDDRGPGQTAGDSTDLGRRRPDIPGGLTALLERMVAPRIEDRPRHVEEALVTLNMTRGRAAPERTAASLSLTGAWVLESEMPQSRSWRRYVVAHATTGVPARLFHLRRDGILRDHTPQILGSAEQAFRLEHPGVLDVKDWGVHEGRAYVVTAAQGCQLGRLLKQTGSLPELEALHLTLAIAEALVYLHGQGLVYQMVNPKHILITADARSAQLGWPMFCVPRGTAVFDADGKPRNALIAQYAPPEVLFGDYRTIETSLDIYGLGEMLHEILAGAPAFSEAQVTALALAKISVPDIRNAAPLVTAPTALLLRALLAPRPKDRPDADVARDELRRIIRRLSPRA